MIHRKTASDFRDSVLDPVTGTVSVPYDEPVTGQAEQPVDYMPRRTRVPGMIGAGVIGAAVAAMVFTSTWDTGTTGQRLATGVTAAGNKIQAQAPASTGDAGITAAIKTALAADPMLSALNIEVDTQQGVVHLDGPAPDEKSRERAAMLASAPRGVVSVENGMVVTQAVQVN